MEEQGFKCCPVCGAQIIKEVMTCPQCGAYVTKLSPPMQEHTNEGRMNYNPTPKSNDKVVLGLLFVVIIIVILAVLASAIIGPMYNTSEEGDGDPFVVRTDPADGATDVEPVFSLKIFFSEPMTRSTTLHHDFWQIATEQTETTWIDNQTAEITNLRFQSFGSITIRFFGDPDLLDREGNWLTEDYDWTFTTRPPNVDILSTITFRDTDDNTFIFIYGELRNNEDFDLIFIDFNVRGYDVNHNLIGTSPFYSHTSPIIVKPNETIPYMSHYRDTNEVVEEIVVEVPNNTPIGSFERYNGLEIIRAEGYFEIYENLTYYIVNGTMINNGDRFVERIEVSATFYDMNEQVVAAVESYTDPLELNVTETLDFEIGVYEGECDVFAIKSYKLMAYDQF